MSSKEINIPQTGTFLPLAQVKWHILGIFELKRGQKMKSSLFMWHFCINSLKEHLGHKKKHLDSPKHKTLTSLIFWAACDWIVTNSLKCVIPPFRVNAFYGWWRPINQYRKYSIKYPPSIIPIEYKSPRFNLWMSNKRPTQISALSNKNQTF